jgi:hypothetical protein
MPLDIQTKYESQLPKLEKWSFDRLFGYTAGIASIGGLIGAPFFIKEQNSLVFLYMGFLSILVIILIIHAVLVEKRKLHRYAQTIFHTHFAQHLVRDSLSELQNDQLDNVKKTTEKILDAIVNSFSITCGKNCRASIIELDNNFELTVAARDSMSEIRATPRDKKHYLKDNTDFKNLWYSINGCSRFYLNNNIVKKWVQHCYKNSSFLENEEPEIKSFLGYNYIKNWPLSYKSALILPIRYISDFSPPKDDGVNEEQVPHWNYYGFLCIDSLSVNSFDNRYSPELGAIFADMLYSYFNQIDFILDTMTQPKESKTDDKS